MRPPAPGPLAATVAALAAALLLAGACGGPDGAGDVDVLGERSERVPGAPLVGTTWVLEVVLPPPEEAATTSAAALEATVEFRVDGTYAIETACNAGSGRYERTAARGRTIELALGPLAVTRQACGEASGSFVESAVLTTFVAGPAEAVLGDRRLTVTTPTGSLGFRAR